MSTVDIVIIAILAWGAYRGWKSGLIKELLSTLGVAVGIGLAVLVFYLFAEHFCPSLGKPSEVSFYLSVLEFVVLWVVMPIMLGVLAAWLGRKLPACPKGWVGSLLGALVGLGKYYVLISFVFTAMAYVGILSPQKKSDSLLYDYVAALGHCVYQDRTVMEESGDWDEKTVIINFDRKDSLETDVAK